jgi:hypothetical protein
MVIYGSGVLVIICMTASDLTFFMSLFIFLFFINV